MDDLIGNIPLMGYKLYECRKGPKEHDGTLIVYATSVADALKIYKRYEKSEDIPHSIQELPYVRGVIHDKEIQ